MQIRPLRLRYYRLHAGLSQEALAELAQVAASTVNKLERGHSTGTPKTLYAIAGALGVDIESITTLDEAREEAWQDCGS